MESPLAARLGPHRQVCLSPAREAGQSAGLGPGRRPEITVVEKTIRNKKQASHSRHGLTRDFFLAFVVSSWKAKHLHKLALRLRVRIAV